VSAVAVRRMGAVDDYFEHLDELRGDELWDRARSI
jgi:hypothetical protein